MSKDSKHNNILKRLLWSAFCVILVALAVYVTMVVTIQGLCNSSVAFSLAARNKITGVVSNRHRDAGNFFLTVSTEQFGDIDVECDIESYKNIVNDSEVSLYLKFAMLQEG